MIRFLRLLLAVSALVLPTPRSNPSPPEAEVRAAVLANMTQEENGSSVAAASNTTRETLA